MRRVFAVVAAAFLLSGCPLQGTIKTLTLSPWTSGGYQTQNFISWECYAPLPGQGLGSPWGFAPLTVGPGEAYSGFQDLYTHGADPAPCIAQQQTLYRGQVVFDLSQFNSVTSATLNFIVENSLEENFGVNQDLPPVSYATTLGMSTGASVSDDNGFYYWNYDNDVQMPSCAQGLIFVVCSVDVSPQVRSWVSGAHQNFGFIIAGPILNFPDQLPSDNAGKVTYYTAFQLLVVYNTAQNPNAPQ